MSVLYLLTSPEPQVEGTDAVWQEVRALQNTFDGARINLFPLKRPNSRFPKLLYGVHRIKTLRNKEKSLKVNHIFVTGLQFLPIFYFLKNPIVYTVIAGMQEQTRIRNIRKLNKLHRIVVSNERDQKILESRGITNCSVISPGIDISSFSPSFLPLEGELTLLLGSAPWEKRQFHSKGVDLLLETAANLSYLKLIFLWRGLLFEELKEKIAYYKVQDRVEVINRKVDVNDVLKRVHATVLLAQHSHLIRPFPHSLIESLAAGKPVLLTRNIPMSDYVMKYQCGVLVDDLRMESFIASVKMLMNRYRDLVQNTDRRIAEEFSIEHMVERYGRLYRLEK